MYDLNLMDKFIELDNAKQLKERLAGVEANLARSKKHSQNLQERKVAEHQRIVSSPTYESPVEKFARLFGDGRQR